jgi:hypothetical protein
MIIPENPKTCSENAVWGKEVIHWAARYSVGSQVNKWAGKYNYSAAPDTRSCLWYRGLHDSQTDISDVGQLRMEPVHSLLACGLIYKSAWKKTESCITQWNVCAKPARHSCGKPDLWKGNSNGVITRISTRQKGVCISYSCLCYKPEGRGFEIR